MGFYMENLSWKCRYRLWHRHVAKLSSVTEMPGRDHPPRQGGEVARARPQMISDDLGWLPAIHRPCLVGGFWPPLKNISSSIIVNWDD